MPKILRFLTLQCYNTIAIAQVCFRDVLMLVCSGLISVAAPRPKRRRENAENFVFLRAANTIAIAQVYFRDILMLARSLISVLVPRPKRR